MPACGSLHPQQLQQTPFLAEDSYFFFLLAEKLMLQAAWISLTRGGHISLIITRQLLMDLLCFFSLLLLAKSLVSEAHALKVVRDFGKSCSCPGEATY